MSTQTTDPSSLSAVAARIEGLLSRPLEDPQSQTTQPEPTPEPAPESQQASAAPSEASEASEQATPENAETTDQESEQPQTFTVKVDGKDHAVTLDELLKGYSFTEHNTRKSQALAEERRALETERQQFQEQDVAAVRAQRSQYESYLTQLSDALKALTPAEPNWQQLRQTVSPEQFAAELLSWQENTKRIAQVDAERASVKAQTDADADKGFRRYVEDERTKLSAALPVMANPETASPHQAKLVEFAKSRGFTEDDLSKVVDHRLVLLLNDAMEFHTSKAKAPTITNKIEQAIATTQPGSRTTSSRTTELDAARARLRSTGRVDDAAEALRLKLFGKR